jgi:hypothetical protein
MVKINFARLLGWSRAPFDSNSYANHLGEFEVLTNTTPDTFVLSLTCVDQIARQCVLALDECGMTELDAPEPWTHRFDGQGPVPKWLNEYLEILKTSLTLVPVEGLDVVTSFDWHKIPPNEDDDEWRTTTAGQMVNYKDGSDGQKNSAVTWIGERLARIFTVHPMYSGAEVIVGALGTTHDFSLRIAKDVAIRRGLTFAEAKYIGAPRRAAKLGAEDSAPREYSIDADLDGKRVAVVDDVYMTGSTMMGIAKAALECGALSVVGLTATRTRRKNG